MQSQYRMKPIPLPKVPSPIDPVNKEITINNIHGGKKDKTRRKTKKARSKYHKGGFKTDIVDDLEDRDDDWIITKQ